MSSNHINIAGASKQQIESVLRLLGEGATIPFISRYRKEATGGLDELQIESVREQHDKIVELEKRRQSILNTIEEQGALSPELREKIENCHDLNELEDLYLPYKPKRKTKASVAREKGLEPLAAVFMKQELSNPFQFAERFVKKEVLTVEEAVEGAQHIMAEWMSERASMRSRIRSLFERSAIISSSLVKGKEEAGQKYRDYFSYTSPIKRTPGHRYLAMSRAEAEGILRVSVEPSKEEAISIMSRYFVRSTGDMGKIVEESSKDAYMRLMRGSMETELRNEYREKAENEAIEIFSKNLEQLLMAAPVGQKSTLALDPGFKSGCKVVCLSEQGELRANTTIFPHPPQKQIKEASAKLSQLIESYHIDVIAVGDGTAGRETEDWIRKSVYKKRPVEIYSVNEDGASIYSASSVAREEFPDFDVTVRGAVSIGRRLMDPLSELVKIDPKSIGVGQYQHDVNPKKLQDKLQFVVESCVNKVGVELNLASSYLLQYVSGLSLSLAKKVIEYRNQNGPFASRDELKKVSGLGPKAFEQCAGFLRISGAKNPLDNSAIHPERYALVKKMAKDYKIKPEELLGAEWIDQVDLNKYTSNDIGLPTLEDIRKEIKKPGRDPRGKARQFAYSEGVNSISDLINGMMVKGKISNITNFGAFVDIGLKENGLIHVSQLSDEFVSDPLTVVSIGQAVNARVLEVDIDRKRIALSLKSS